MFSFSTLLELVFILAIGGALFWGALVLLTMLKRALFGKGSTVKKPKTVRQKSIKVTPTIHEKWEQRARNMNKARDRDPIRFFHEAGLSKAIYSRALSRCEHKLKRTRCTETKDLQLDHIYPWHHGGWTIISNAQVLCKAHNEEKGARVPSNSELNSIAINRIVSFPHNSPDERDVRWEPNTEERAMREIWLQSNEAHIPPMPLSYEG